MAPLCAPHALHRPRARCRCCVGNVFQKHITVIAAGFTAIAINMDLSSKTQNATTVLSQVHGKRRATFTLQTPASSAHIFHTCGRVMRRPNPHPRPYQNHLMGYCVNITCTLLMTTPIVRACRGVRCEVCTMPACALLRSVDSQQEIKKGDVL